MNQSAEAKLPHPWNLGQVAEMWIAGEKQEVVFDDQRCDPHIICRDWRTLLTQLIKNLTEISYGLRCWIQDRNPWTVEESVECLLILPGLSTKQES